jgi:hypothetical protein
VHVDVALQTRPHAPRTGARLYVTDIATVNMQDIRCRHVTDCVPDPEYVCCPRALGAANSVNANKIAEEGRMMGSVSGGTGT